MLSPSQIEQYREQGYVLVPDAIDADTLAYLRDRTDRWLDESRAVAESNDVFDLDAGHSAESPRLTRIKRPDRLDPRFFDVLTSDTVSGVLRDLLGEAVRLQTSKLNTKAPGGGAAVEWHQDWAFYPHTNDDMLAIGLMLDDVDVENGPLLVQPGTHRGPVLDHCVSGAFAGAVDPRDPLFDDQNIVTLTGTAGSMTFHHVRLLHGSAPNTSDHARRMCFFELCAADAWPLAGSVAYSGLSQPEIWDMITGQLVFGEQPLQPRLADVPVRLPMPPALDSSSIFQTQRGGGVTSAFGVLTGR